MTNQPNRNYSTMFAAYLLTQQARNLTRSYLTLLSLTRDYWVRRFGDMPIDEVTTDHIRIFLVWLQGQDDTSSIEPPRGAKGSGLSGSSVNIHYRNTKAFMNWLEDEELIGRSPMKKVKAPKYSEKLPEALTEGEAALLLQNVRTDGDPHAWRDYCIHLFFLDTCVRLQELSSLDLDDLNMEEGYAKVFGKGRKERLVPLGIELRRELTRYLLKHRAAAKGEQALFVNEQGFRFDRQGIRTMVVRDLKRYVPRTLAKCGPHTLRHTGITLKLRKTRDLKTTSLIAGHSTTRTTERYVHLVGADVLRDAAGSAMDDLVRR